MNSAQRELLHKDLDKLLDRRISIESGCPPKNNRNGMPDSSYAAYRDVVEFASRVCGEHMIVQSLTPYWSAHTKEGAILMTLRERLGALLPLINLSNQVFKVATDDCGHLQDIEYQFDIESVQSELLALARGDETNLFKRQKGKKGQPSNQFQLTKMALRALQWEAFLLSEHCSDPHIVGLRADDIRREIAGAFGASTWDTVRHWKTRCENSLGVELVDYLVRVASVGSIEGFKGPMTIESMREDGKKYQDFRSEHYQSL